MKTVIKNIDPYSYESKKFNKLIFVKKHNRRYHIKLADDYRVFNLKKKEENLLWLKDPELEKEVRKAIRGYKAEREEIPEKKPEEIEIIAKEDKIKDFFGGEPIHTYTIQQAVADNVLYDIRTQLKSEIRDKSILSHATVNLMSEHGYFNYDKSGKRTVNVPNLFGLLNQSARLIDKKKLGRGETLFSGEIETPNGEDIKVFVQLNELQKFTVMLPKDY